ncbi:glucose-6-phosphate dehydrogenase [Desemzia sp. RIT804]|uniref:glucose-6-phosphate dehydrogenase n=1 Tax=Desemzia sp. RIT 804 TaxID=2810209 RepID=UPI0019520B18|nr:glucose-6-phosphate dehydrogenase [Desemzia sp. RIT 804]MBM6613587.1 glucose-6-phosphate dehydrogenase [Desemzia sp. RIT 804]
MSKKQVGGLLVLFGATGDLASRMLLPALHQLYQRGLVSENFAILGASRTKMTDKEFQEYARKSVEKGSNFEKFDESFFEHCRYQVTDNTKLEDLKQLREKIELVAKEFETPDEYIHYYSIAPELYDETTMNIKKAQITELQGNHRVIIEKPFGNSLATAEEYQQLLLKTFDKEEIYFMDHFPGMDFIQNILATRFYNPLIEGIWNNKFIENVQISLPENLSIGTRGSFYEENGALLDMFQNHLLQILAIVAMELPDKLTTEMIHENKLLLLQNLPTLTKEQVEQKVVRGQYKADSEGKYKSYRSEENVASESDTDTYVAIELTIDTPLWQGVPFYLRTGKALIEDYTAIDILLKSSDALDSDVATRITFMVEPAHGVSLVLNQKMPNNEYEPVTTFIGPDEETFKDHYIADPYENMIHDALEGDQTYFPAYDEIKEQWRLTDSIVADWKELPEPDFPNYRANTFGPIEAEDLLTKNNHEWAKRI